MGIGSRLCGEVQREQAGVANVMKKQTEMVDVRKAGRNGGRPELMLAAQVRAEQACFRVPMLSAGYRPGILSHCMTSLHDKLA
jgi:hypothetical protein